MKVVEKKIDELKPDPKNARRHGARNRDAITRSLKEFGQVEPLIVQQSTGIVIGGNERLSILKALKYKTVKVIEVDLDDNKARLLALALNRTGELGEWNEKLLAEILADAQTQEQDLEAAGFSSGEVDRIIQMASFKDKVSELGGTKEDEPEAKVKKVKEKIELDDGEETELETEDEEDEEAPEEEPAEDAPGEANSVYAIRDDVFFPSEEMYDIPALKKDMLAPCPSSIRVFTGPTPTGLAAASLVPEAEYELVIWGKGYESTIKDWSNKIIGFYIEDVYFNACWADAAAFATRLKLMNPYAVITPNFSTSMTDPMAIKIFTQYRKQWCGRLWQEAGLRVIPDVYVKWTLPNEFSLIFSGIPRKVPCLALEMQCDVGLSEETFQLARSTADAAIQAMMKTVDPQSLLVYDSGMSKYGDLLDGLLPSTIPVQRVLSWNCLRKAALKIVKKKGE